MHRLPFEKSKSIADACFGLVHMDLWGPYRVPSICGGRYFLTVVDDHTRSTWTFLMKSKDQVYGIIVEFLAFVETQFNTRVRVLRTDNGTEFVQRKLGSV